MIAKDLAALVRIPSQTGIDRAALQWLAARAAQLGLAAALREHEVADVRAHPGHPGEVGAPRRVAERRRPSALPAAGAGWRSARTSTPSVRARFRGATATRAPGDRGRPRVRPRQCRHEVGRDRCAPRPGGGRTHRPRGHAPVRASEEDGGVGAFAALLDDAGYDAVLIPEPTGWDVICAQAGALTFTGTIRGVATLAATRLAGRSAIDRYVDVHRRLAEYERALNADVEHPLMRELELPYPLLVGRIEGGTWSSQVPDRVVFEGRLGLRVGEDPDAARSAFEAVAQDGEDPHVDIAWSGGAFLSAQTRQDDPFVQLVSEAVAAERGTPPRPAGVPWGADMRHFTAHGIPTTMVGTTGIERAHAVDEYVEIAEVEALPASCGPSSSASNGRLRPAGGGGGVLGGVELALDEVEPARPRSPGRRGRCRRCCPSSSGGCEPPARSSSR